MLIGILKTILVMAVWFSLSMNIAANAKAADSECDAAYTETAKQACVNLLRKAEQGDADAQFHIGRLYYNGDGLAQNYNEAFKWLESAAEKGVVQAQFFVGLMHQQGLGVIQSYADAIKWYKLAAEQHDEDAQVSLGNLYNQGLGTLQSYDKAFEWYKLAAEQGNAYGQALLGYYYVTGRGVTQNDVFAHMWFNLAAAQGHSGGSDGRDRVARQMTQAQIAEAQRLASECLAKNYKDCSP